MAATEWSKRSVYRVEFQLADGSWEPSFEAAGNAYNSATVARKKAKALAGLAWFAYRITRMVNTWDSVIWSQVGESIPGKVNLCGND